MSKTEAVLSAIDAGLDASLARLFELLSIASISTDPAFKPEVEKAAAWLGKTLKELGFDASVRPTTGHPMVIGHREGRKAGPHLVFYGHYDVQPVDPLDLWETPPFEPMIKEVGGKKRIVARGAADDKGQLMTFIEAVRATLAVEGSLPCPVTIVLEGEEECGSPSLPAFLAANKEELKGDLILVCDTGMVAEGVPTITTALRGMAREEMTIIAADRDLHSGMYGSAAANPIRVLSRILSAIHDDNNHVTIPGFYDGVAEVPAELAADWAGLPFDEKKFLGEIGLSVPAGEKGMPVLHQLWARPTAEINGIWGGYTGAGTKTVIPSEAHAKLTFRLVGQQDPNKVIDAFRAFVRERLPADCKVRFSEGDDHGSPALELPQGSEAITRTKAALTQEWGRKAVTVGSGGSIPILGSFKRELGMDSLMVGFGLDDDRVHSPNEKYDLQSFHKGTRSWARILAALAE
jgi:acetylornithine deacetylase/succinyl-diaminopimelate desuccinylase-like protein